MPDYLGLADEIVSPGGILTGKEVIEKIRHFRDAFSSFTIHDLAIHTINIAEDKSAADVECEISYSGIVEGSIEVMTFSGMGTFIVKNKQNRWDIYSINIPGIAI